MAKKLLAALGAAAAVALLWIAFAGGPGVRNAPAKEGPVVLFGDSLAEGVGATEGSDLASLLSRRAGREVANLGNSGDTAADGLARIGEALALEPSVAIVVLGGNDFLRRVPVAETFESLRQVVAAFQGSGAAVIVLGVRGGLLSDQYEDRYEALAEGTGSAYVSDVLDGLIGDRRYMSDQVHPNDAGYARIADRVYPVLEGILKKR